MINLANGYYNGEEIEKAFHWFQKAAENGEKRAMFILAACYNNGEGTVKNLEKAIYWNQKAAENGNTDAMINLANGYYNGEEIEKAFYC
ncbi:unnamed protein product [Rhizophagus irregularis]|nr:unnamed protein product [Rhizophagus irregularis]